MSDHRVDGGGRRNGVSFIGGRVVVAVGVVAIGISREIAGWR